MRSPEFVPFRQSLCLACIACALVLFANIRAAGETKLSEPERQLIIRDFLAESPFVHRALPRGKSGVRIEGSKLTPADAELGHLVAQYGAVAKPGDRVKITAVRFERHGVLFEINGGPVKRKNWRERVNVGINNVDPRTVGAQPNDDSVYDKSTGSSVFLELKDSEKLTSAQIKDLLAPVLDFKAMNVAEAYQKSLPPKLAAAVKNHHALVGMDKEMVLYALGRPPQRVRETKDGKEIEEWIYGAPPQDVQFIRFLGDRAVSIEDMKVSGEMTVRTQDEVGDLAGVMAEKHQKPEAMAADSEEESRAAPTLLRPGEKQESAQSASRDRNPSPMPDPIPPPDPGSNPTPNPAGRMPTGGDTPNQP
jgi:hypothetical protein